MLKNLLKLKDSGFTLIEMLIVIMIITILVGVSLPRIQGMQDEGNIAKSKGELKTLQTAVESYYIHNSYAYPAAITAITSATPLVVATLPDDPFAASGTKYVYVRGGTGNKYYVIYSIGTGANGSAAISSDDVSETNGSSCIYISNMATVDSAP
ncbi:MAG: prepilin-type N-terminal cleavage/methylation domain-containing protein [Candidatus Omnitrophota bacterium]|jgi:prepilin-type N-terminal cleavage/methylation domain-containing protein